MDHSITGEWVPADESSNRLELAPTTDESLVAIRDTHDPSSVLFATDRQIENMVNAYQRGLFKSIMGSGSTHSSSGTRSSSEALRG